MSAEPLPPPMRILVQSWFGRRDLSYAEAEAWHLRKAAKLAGSRWAWDRVQQDDHLEEARRNRVWRRKLEDRR